VPFPLTNLEQISRLDKIQYVGHATEGDLDAILLIRRFNHYKMADTRTSEMVTVELSNFWRGCKTFDSQRMTMELCVMIDLYRMNNFQ
jgi:hypothetical protein